MEEGILIALAAYLSTAVLFIGLAIPLILRKIPRNKWYGFRFKKALRNDAVWYDVNAYGGWWMLVVGIIMAVLSGGLLIIPEESIETYVAVVAVGITVLTMLLVILPLVRLNQYDENSYKDG